MPAQRIAATHVHLKKTSFLDKLITIRLSVIFGSIITVGFGFYVRFYFVDSRHTYNNMSVIGDFHNYSLIDPSSLSIKATPFSPPASFDRPTRITTEKYETTKDLRGALILAPILPNATNVIFSPTISIGETSRFNTDENTEYYKALQSTFQECARLSKAGDLSCRNNLPKINKMINERIKK